MPAAASSQRSYDICKPQRATSLLSSRSYTRNKGCWCRYLWELRRAIIGIRGNIQKDVGMLHCWLTTITATTSIINVSGIIFTFFHFIDRYKTSLCILLLSQNFILSIETQVAIVYSTQQQPTSIPVSQTIRCKATMCTIYILIYTCGHRKREYSRCFYNPSGVFTSCPDLHTEDEYWERKCTRCLQGIPQRWRSRLRNRYTSPERLDRIRRELWATSFGVAGPSEISGKPSCTSIRSTSINVLHHFLEIK